MSTQHTPGPWRVECDPCHFHTMSDVVGGEYRKKSHPPHQLFVAVGGHCDVAEQEANARLIAAAPELLEALEGMLNYAYDRDDAVRTITWQQARDAVAKAKGNQ